MAKFGLSPRGSGIKIVYIGGGSTRAAGTMASFIQHAANFPGAHFVLVDIDADRLAVVLKLAQKMALEAGVDITISANSDRRQALQGCDIVLTSFRPGGFEARYIDESIPLKHGVLGQETQGPGGFFMALRSIQVIKEIVKDIERICPNAFLINYTNPINIVSQAVTENSNVKTISLCEGPIVFPRWFAEVSGLDPNKLDTTMIGLNHGSWSIRHLYDGADFMPLLKRAYERLRHDPSVPVSTLRLMRLAVTMGSLPAHYFQYFYYNTEIVGELRSRLPSTRASDILAEVPSYWDHYREQAETPDISVLDPRLSRGGILELELAVNVIVAIINNSRQLWPVNVPNNGALADFPNHVVVEVPAFIDQYGATPMVCGHMPPQVSGLVKHLADYQVETARAAWSGTRKNAVRALASHPLVPGLDVAEKLYDEMAGLHAKHLPLRLLKG
jgi:6-phospho-beta-glucosidase